MENFGQAQCSRSSPTLCFPSYQLDPLKWVYETLAVQRSSKISQQIVHSSLLFHTIIIAFFLENTSLLLEFDKLLNSHGWKKLIFIRCHAFMTQRRCWAIREINTHRVLNFKYSYLACMLAACTFLSYEQQGSQLRCHKKPNYNTELISYFRAEEREKKLYQRDKHRHSL